MVVAPALAASTVVASLQPALASSAHWVFYEGTVGCHNKIQEVSLGRSGTTSVRRTLHKARRGHEIGPLSIRDGQLLYYDFNCRSGATSLSVLSLKGPPAAHRVFKPSQHSIVAVFDTRGSHIIVGWNHGSSFELAKIRTSNGRQLSLRTFPGHGYLIGLGAGTVSTVYAQVESLTNGSTSVLTVRGTELYRDRLHVKGRWPGFASSSDASEALVSDTAHAHLRISWGTFEVSLGLPTKVAVCGSGQGMAGLAWVGDEALLVKCQGLVFDQYELVELGGLSVHRHYLSGPVPSGNDPVGTV